MPRTRAIDSARPSEPIIAVVLGGVLVVVLGAYAVFLVSDAGWVLALLLGVTYLAVAASVTTSRRASALRIALAALGLTSIALGVGRLAT